MLRWDAVSYALMGPPNDEARYQHRLYDSGLKDLDWIGIVRTSSLVRLVRPMLSSHLASVLMHYIVVSKECTVEVVAETVDVFRIAGSTRDAAPASFGP